MSPKRCAGRPTLGNRQPGKTLLTRLIIDLVATVDEWRHDVVVPFDGSYRRYDRVVIAGSPLRLFRLMPAAARRSHRTASAAAERTHEVDRPVSSTPAPSIPAQRNRRSPPRMPHRRAAFNAQPSPSRHDGDMIVVDDASHPPLPPIPGCAVIRLPVNRGPGWPQRRLTEVTTPLVAVRRHRCRSSDGWPERLLAHFNDPQVALVAPASVRLPVHRRLSPSTRRPDRLSTWRPSSAHRRGHRRASYVPAAAIVVRTDSLRGSVASTRRCEQARTSTWCGV